MENAQHDKTERLSLVLMCDRDYYVPLSAHIKSACFFINMYSRLPSSWVYSGM